VTEEEAVRLHASDYALGRISTDEDIAAATLFLASRGARQITGIDLPVDGGWAAL
jgi:3-oxoacyl-[acyl-carrier protein] reductase